MHLCHRNLEVCRAYALHCMCSVYLRKQYRVVNAFCFTKWLPCIACSIEATIVTPFQSQTNEINYQTGCTSTWHPSLNINGLDNYCRCSMAMINPRCMRSEGYSSLSVGLSVCLSVYALQSTRQV